MAATVEAIRPMVPDKDFEISKCFYEELGFQPQALTDDLVEMLMGRISFILQNYYIKEWADNFVIHMRVSDVNAWWKRITSLDLVQRYGINAKAPQPATHLVPFTILPDQTAVLHRDLPDRSSGAGKMFTDLDLR